MEQKEETTFEYIRGDNFPQMVNSYGQEGNNITVIQKTFKHTAELQNSTKMRENIKN